MGICLNEEIGVPPFFPPLSANPRAHMIQRQDLAKDGDLREGPREVS